MSAVILDAIKAKLAQEEFSARLAKRKPVTLERSSGAVVDEVRQERDSELRR